MNRPDHLHILIDRFFEATATEAEEAELKHLLTDPTLTPDKEIDEARAVMGFASIQRAVLSRDERAPRRSHRFMRIAAAAAVLAGIAIPALLLLVQPQQPQSYALIYSNGCVEESTDKALAIMQSQLGAIGAAELQSPAAEALSALNSMLSPE